MKSTRREDCSATGKIAGSLIKRTGTEKDNNEYLISNRVKDTLRRKLREPWIICYKRNSLKSFQCFFLRSDRALINPSTRRTFLFNLSLSRVVFYKHHRMISQFKLSRALLPIPLASRTHSLVAHDLFNLRPFHAQRTERDHSHEYLAISEPKRRRAFPLCALRAHRWRIAKGYNHGNP